MRYAPIYPAFERLQAQLEHWAALRPELMTLETLGHSAEGRPIHAATLTAPEADPTHKQHVLLTAQHSGIERTATTSLFSLMEWLLSADPAAAEILRQSVVVMMPVVNPDGYVHGTHPNTAGHDPYTRWTLEGPAFPDEMPEAVAVQQMMDLWRPDVHADAHGLDLSFPGYISLENSGASYSNTSLRAYHRELVAEMDAAALEAGYPSELLEQDAERLFWGPELEAMAHKCWVGRPRIYAAIYCYYHYHSLLSAAEVMWSESGYLRHRRLLELASRVWPGEPYSGYPTRVIDTNTLYSIVAYGTGPAARRQSRVELWNRLEQMTHGMVNPQTEGLVFYVCATSRVAAEALEADPSLEGLRRLLQQSPDIDHEPLLPLLETYPDGAGQWGERPAVYLSSRPRGETASSLPRHGAGFRLRIPYGRAELLDTRLNGRPLAVSETEGYFTYCDRGYTVLQVNVPPQRAAAEDLLVVTCRYDPRETRRQVWEPRV